MPTFYIESYEDYFYIKVKIEKYDHFVVIIYVRDGFYGCNVLIKFERPYKFKPTTFPADPKRANFWNFISLVFANFTRLNLVHRFLITGNRNFQ